MSHNQPFSCCDLFISLWKCIRFIVTYIVQYELSTGMKISNLGHDLLFRIMT